MRKELLVGCGYSRVKKINDNTHSEWEGLVTLDVNTRCEPDVVWNLNTLPYPFEDNTFDEVHAYCVLEHCSTQGNFRFFFAQWQEFWRIMKPEGRFFGIVPKHDSPWAWGDPSHTRIISLESLTFLDQSQYESQIGRTPMSDFRDIYTADFKIMGFQPCSEHQVAFSLRADKAMFLASTKSALGASPEAK